MLHSSIVITIRPDQTSARYSSRSFCHRAMNEVSKRAANREWCAMTFISDRGYDVRPRGEIASKKKRIDLTLRKILPPRSSESGISQKCEICHI